ncbi:hypothetical protein D068_cds02570 [Bacillus atrophaeus UCMB-5137]|nr:hypothetical protein D068_cds02570 [Bacillus atrophaeus UCMB-5137]
MFPQFKKIKPCAAFLLKYFPFGVSVFGDKIRFEEGDCNGVQTKKRMDDVPLIVVSTGRMPTTIG